MTDGAKTFRLGIAVFPGPDGVWPAVVALLEGGFRLHQLCLAARTETLARLPQTAIAYRARQPAMDLLIDRVSEPRAPSETVSDGIVVCFDRCRDSDGDVDSLASPADWTRPELCGNVLEHLVANSVVLGVSSETTRQQLVSTRILLEYSSQRVLTQEFILPARH